MRQLWCNYLPNSLQARLQPMLPLLHLLRDPRRTPWLLRRLRCQSTWHLRRRLRQQQRRRPSGESPVVAAATGASQTESSRRRRGNRDATADGSQQNDGDCVRRWNTEDSGRQRQAEDNVRLHNLNDVSLI